MPRASKPARPSMRLLMRWKRPMTPASLPAPASSRPEEASVAATTWTLTGSSSGRAFSRSCVAAALDIVSPPSQARKVIGSARALGSSWWNQGGFPFSWRGLLVNSHVLWADGRFCRTDVRPAEMTRGINPAGWFDAERRIRNWGPRGDKRTKAKDKFRVPGLGSLQSSRASRHATTTTGGWRERHGLS